MNFRFTHFISKGYRSFTTSGRYLCYVVLDDSVLRARGSQAGRFVFHGQDTDPSPLLTRHPARTGIRDDKALWFRGKRGLVILNHVTEVPGGSGEGSANTPASQFLLLE